MTPNSRPAAEGAAACRPAGRTNAGGRPAGRDAVPHAVPLGADGDRQAACPRCVEALALWAEGEGHHLSCRACEERAAGAAPIAERAVFYAQLLSRARASSATEGIRVACVVGQPGGFLQAIARERARAAARLIEQEKSR
jgi:hypothetical protein